MLSTTNDPNLISITIRLYSILRHRDGQVVNRMNLKLPRGSRIQDVLNSLGIDPELEVILAVNSELAEENTELGDGDQVSIIPAVAGGKFQS